MNGHDAVRPIVLIVDDDPHARAIHAEWLTHGGYDVRDADSGEAGLRMARTSDPSLILIDLKMPGMDGWTLLEHLRADPITRTAPLVALTIVGPGEDRRDPVRRGFDEHWVKPITMAALLAGVKRLIGDQQRP
jgi:two-component system, cell cycle response regulator DivK